MNLIALPAFIANDIWMFHDGTPIVVVDPLAAILVTDRHANQGHKRKVNPFPRVADNTVALSARAHGVPSNDPAVVPAALRQWKNELRC